MGSNKKSKILVVDDTEFILSALQEALQYYGYDVYTSDNGLDALRMTTERDYDLILLDIKLPRMDGVEAFERIKEIKAYIPIVFISGLGHFDRGKEFIEMGAYYYLPKPLNLDEVLATVERALRRPSD